MIAGFSVLVIVPARRGSKGLPLKNIRPLHGKPLLAWPIAAARGSAYVDEVIISTDDREFADIAVAHGALAPFLRPPALASDTATSMSFIEHAVDTLEGRGRSFDIVMLLEPTSPLTEASDVDAALEQLVAAGDAADAIVGIQAMETVHPAFCVTLTSTGTLMPYGNARFDAMPRRQDLPPVFALDGSLYASTVAAMRARGTFVHERTLGYVGARYKAFEVDDLVDFICIEALMARRDELAADPPSQV